MVTVISGAISWLLMTLLDIDRVDMKRMGDETHIYFTTTCLRGNIGEKLSEIKMRLFTLLDLPMKTGWEIVEKERVQDNPVTSQWNITVSVPTEGILAGGGEGPPGGRIRERARKMDLLGG